MHLNQSIYTPNVNCLRNDNEEIRLTNNAQLNSGKIDNLEALLDTVT